MSLTGACEACTSLKISESLLDAPQEFFISLIDHSDWGKAHTVFGEVCTPKCYPYPSLLPFWLILRDMQCMCAQVDPKDMDKAVKKLLKQPWHEYRHPEFGTLMRMLDTEAPFTIGLAGDKTAT